MANSVVQTIRDAEVDARSLSEFIYSPADAMISRRLAPSIHSLQYYIDKINSVNNAFSKAVSDANTAADVAISAANTANQNAIGLIDNVTNQATQSVQNAISGVAVDANLVTDALITIVPMSSGAIARTQLEKNRENISVLDFFTDVELTAYKANKTTFDAYRPLQEFFDYIANNNVGEAYCSGTFYISEGIRLSRSGGSLTKQVSGYFELIAMNAIDTMFLIQAGEDFNWVGTIRVQGTGGKDYDTRTCRIGLQVGGDIKSNRNTFGSIIAINFSYIGIYFANLTTLNYTQSIRAMYCGSGNPRAGYSLTSNFNRVSESGNINSVGQRTVISVDVMPPVDIGSSLMYVIIGGTFYHVMETNHDTNELTLFPFLDYTVDSGELVYIYGAGLLIRGADAGVQRISKLDCMLNGIGVHDAAMYGAVLDNVVCQSNGVGLAVGLRYTSAHVGGQINGLYSEGNTFDFVKVSGVTMSKTIVSQYALRFSKVVDGQATRNGSNELHMTGAFSGVALISGGKLLTREGRSLNIEGSSTTIDITDSNRSIKTVYSDSSQTIYIKEPDIQKHILFGYTNLVVHIVGAGDRGEPSGEYLFIPPEGYTVNGKVNDSFKGFNGIASFIVTLMVNYKNIIVSCMNPSGIYKVNYEATTLEAGGETTTDITVSSIPSDTFLSVMSTVNLPNIILSASWLDATTVRVRHKNNTEEEITIPKSKIILKVN